MTLTYTDLENLISIVDQFHKEQHKHFLRLSLGFDGFIEVFPDPEVRSWHEECLREMKDSEKKHHNLLTKLHSLKAITND